MNKDVEPSRLLRYNILDISGQTQDFVRSVGIRTDRLHILEMGGGSLPQEASLSEKRFSGDGATAFYDMIV